MPEPAEYLQWDWTVRHGDSDRTPPVAALLGRGQPLADLSDWTVRAQIRDRGGNLIHTFTRDVGIIIGAGEATVGDRPPTPIATLRLRLRRGDYSASSIPRGLRGASYDLEISRGDVGKTLMGGTFETLKDTSHG